MSVFEELYAINVNEKVEKKSNLSYLSWAWAWAEFKKRCPDANYEILMFDGKPYLYDENLGYLCMVTVTANGESHTMWLPVMDSANNAMKAIPYTIPTKYGEKSIQAATMFDINKTLMRCLVKCIGMFGLGLYIYAGEDLPEVPKLTDKVKQDALVQKAKDCKVTQKDLLTALGVSAMDKLTMEDFTFAMALLDNYANRTEFLKNLCESEEVPIDAVLTVTKAENAEQLSIRGIKNLMDINTWMIVKGKAQSLQK